MPNLQRRHKMNLFSRITLKDSSTEEFQENSSVENIEMTAFSHEEVNSALESNLNSESQDSVETIANEVCCENTNNVVEESVESTCVSAENQVCSEEVPNLSDPDKLLGQSFGKVFNELARIQDALSTQSKMLEASVDKDEIIHKLHKELTQHRDNFKQEAMMPLVKCITKLSERLIAISQTYEEKFSEIEALPAVAKDLLREVEACNDGLMITLDEFDIEPITPHLGDIFNPKRHKCVGTLPAETDEQKNLIAQVKRNGFENIDTGRIIIYPDVVIYK